LRCFDAGVRFDKWLERDPKEPIEDFHGNSVTDERLEMWWRRSFHPDFQMVANDLYSKGLLEAGDYGILIDRDY